MFTGYCVSNLFGGGAYNKGERLSVKCDRNTNLGVCTQNWL